MQVTQCIMYIWFPPGLSVFQERLPNDIFNKIFKEFFCKVFSCLNTFHRLVEISPIQSYEVIQHFVHNYAVQF